MSDIHYNLNFKKLCNTLKLGEITGKPEAISGGLLHKMFSITTTSGKYAIKALNPRIMLRPMAFTNFIKSERIANIAAAVIPALPAKIFNNTCMQEIDNQLYLVFDWVDGIIYKPDETSIKQCEKIGSILADMHMTDFSALRLTNNRSKKEELIDWNFYLVKGKESNAVWVNLLNEVSDKLYDLNTLANDSAKLLSADCVISHRDLEPKNVIWRQNGPLIIDWESAGYINPMQDLIETAVYWSRNKAGSIDKDRFSSFIRAYKEKCGTINVNWRIVLTSGYSSKLGWLEYSLKRSLWIECTDEKEQQLGTIQVTGTINGIKRYADIILELENWLINEI